MLDEHRPPLCPFMLQVPENRAGTREGCLFASTARAPLKMFLKGYIWKAKIPFPLTAICHFKAATCSCPFCL